MRRILPIILIVIFFAAAGCWYVTRARTQPALESSGPAGPGDVYLALGDSLAAGFTVSQPDEAYVARIGAALRQRQPIAIRNVAVPGETSVSILRAQLPRALGIIEEERAAGRRVSPITIDIGGNDALAVERAPNDVREAAIARIERNIGTLLDQLIAATTEDGQRTADIVIMTYYNPFPGDESDPDSAAYWGVRLNEAIARVAEERGVAVADISDAFAGGNVYRYTYIAAGDVHANADGHALIAQHFVEALGYE
jgi:lysophospholipase L1-like esterase